MTKDRTKLTNTELSWKKKCEISQLAVEQLKAERKRNEEGVERRDKYAVMKARMVEEVYSSILDKLLDKLSNRDY